MSYLIPLVEPWYDRASGWSSHAEGMRPYWYVAWDPSGGSFTMTSVPLADLRLIQRQVPVGSSADIRSFGWRSRVGNSRSDFRKLEPGHLRPDHRGIVSQYAARPRVRPHGRVHLLDENIARRSWFGRLSGSRASVRSTCQAPFSNERA